MDGFNEKSNEEVEQQQPLGCLHRFSKTIKIVIIGGLIILLMIPMFMIEDLISERGRTQEEAINEVSEKWSLAQTVTGPYLNIQYPVITENKGEKKVSIKDLMLFPDELSINGQLKTEILKRSIYEVNVYQSELTLKGSFSSEELRKSRIDIEQLQLDRAAICLNLTDMRGISEQISIALGDSVYIFEPGNGTGQKRYKYYYDHAGNLTSWRIEDGTATNTQEEHTYTYGDSNWKDLLTAFDGKAITYDANGNPTKYSPPRVL